MNIRFSLKNRLFIVILCVLIFNVILSLILGTTLFDKLYTYDKINNLKIGVDSVKSKYLSNNMDKTIEEIIKLESQNMTICIFSLNTDLGMGQIEYFSRQKYFSSNPFDNQILHLIERLYKDKAFDKLKNNKYFIDDNEDKDRMDNNLTILSYIGNDKYILMQTPRKFIKDISNSAIKYSLYISIFSFLIGAIVIYFIADRTTKPIRQIQIVADKISNLDFTDKCDIFSKDEIGLLSNSINNMSNKLQDSISQLMVANEKLKEDLIKQEKADRMTKQFIANVSHDFKTPLTLIMSYSEALLDIKNIDEDTKEEYLNIIINEGNKMSEFVQELLKLSKLESGIIKLEKSNFSINEIINDTINKNSILLKNKNLSVEKDIFEDFIVYADYLRIEQVFQNLYENAIKYSEINGSVRVTTINENNKCVVKIFNTGKYISDEDIENIFISFYRSDKSRKNMGSYGLGLAIVKVIMEMHDENYGVRNIDDGVEFWFELENVNIDLEMED